MGGACRELGVERSASGLRVAHELNVLDLDEQDGDRVASGDEENDLYRFE